ncbi:hypothetical protein ACFOLG_07345 [Vogesella facilis]|uniref:Flagellar protein FliT n=1 Tax=Vogesella facilis TaxID=1655232 RepID=A0ABV7RDT1_9NEIS
MVPSDSPQQSAAVRQLLPLLQDMLLLAQRGDWDGFAERREQLAALDYRILSAEELSVAEADGLRAELLQAQLLLQQLTMLAQLEQKQLSGQLVTMSNQNKLDATYGQ